MKLRVILALLSLVPGMTSFASSQSPAVKTKERFAKYPVAIRFHGKPASPKLESKDALLFRTRIREGVAKGVVFADHYSVPVWGCGAGCVNFAIVDAITGRVYIFPFTVSQDNEAGEQLSFHRNSRAMHLIGSLNEANSADRWYVWDGEKLNLVSESPALDSSGQAIQR